MVEKEEAGAVLPSAVLNGWAGTVAAFTDAMTPETVSSLMRMLSQLAELGDRLARPEVAALLDRLLDMLPTLERVLDRVERMERDGGLAHVEELLGFLGTALSAATPELISAVAGTAERLLEMADQLMQSELFRQLPDALGDVNLVLREPPRHSPHGELRHLMGRLRDPDVQDGLELLLEILKRAGRGAREEAMRRKNPEAAGLQPAR